ncbi:MAG: DUF1707 domain-containing protein [Thermomicrobia bacterium]|nr:DUF1707 domain-containing protein [Thermomicrobia bacterium]MCA1723420.1 DUF1707 domain-containing protein [Thermomicrobia bacterium]
MDSDRTHRNDEASGRAGGTYGRKMRASDADREATAERLRRHYTEGRLDAQEYDERIDRCYAAKTMGELDELFADLPRPAPPSPEPGHRYRGYLPGWRFAAVAPIVAAIIVVCAGTGAHLFWLAWPLFFFFVFRPFGRWCRVGRDRHQGTA